MHLSNAHLHIADLLRIVGLNRKFLSDRRKELLACESYSLSAILKSFDIEGKGYSTSADILRFIDSRYIVHTDEEFISILEEVDLEDSGMISPAKLAVFFGDNKRLTEPSNLRIVFALTEEVDKELISIFEQAISNHRRLQVCRSKLREYGDPYSLFKSISGDTGDLTAQQVIEFVQEHCAIDNQLVENIIKCLDNSGRLTYRLFCQFAISPKTASTNEFHSRPVYSTALTHLSNCNVDEPITHSAFQKDKYDNVYLNQLINRERSMSAHKTGKITRGRRIEELHTQLNRSLDGQFDTVLEDSKEFPTINVTPAITNFYTLKEKSFSRSGDIIERSDMYSPSLARLHDFQEKIKQLQSEKTVEKNERRTGQLTNTLNRVRSTNYSSNEQLHKKFRIFESTYQNENKACTPIHQQFKSPKHDLRLNQTRGSVERDDYPLSHATNILQNNIRGSVEITKILQNKQDQIFVERNIRNRLQKQIEKSKKQINELKKLLNQSNNDMPRVMRISSPQNLHYTYQSIATPTLINQTQERQIGKIRSHNLSLKKSRQHKNQLLLDKVDSSTKHQPVVNKYNYDRASRRYHLERDLTHFKLKRDLDTIKPLYR